MGSTFLETWHFIFVHFDEAILSQNILKWLLIQKQWLNQFKESLRVELEEPFQKLVCSNESYDIENVHAPLEGCERTIGKLLALQEHSDDPHELVADIRLTMLNIKLIFPLSLLFLFLLMFLLHGFGIV